jgi:hypothetical protein
MYLFNVVYLMTLSVNQSTSVPYNIRVTEKRELKWRLKEEVVAYFWPLSLKFPPWIERNHQEP